MARSKLFRPIQVGNMTLAHRVGMSPLTRLRASPDHVPLDIMVEYYSQRAGIYSKEQIHAWKRVTDAVHRKGSYIFCQLWVPGRTALEDFADLEGMCIYSSSPTPLKSSCRPPRELTLAKIQEKIDSHVQAARNAIAAGFDGIEIHGANGYLIDQFTQDCCNKRTDRYGGSIKNRSRFAVELVTAISQAIGPERVGLRLSPWSNYNGMRMDDPIPQFSDLITSISTLNIAYLHLIESRIVGVEDADSTDPSESLAFAYDLWKGPLLVAGGFTPESARRLVDVERPDKDIVVTFGRCFLSTPDLPFRIRHNIQLNQYDRSTFYAPEKAVGYIDYPFCDEFLHEQNRLSHISWMVFKRIYGLLREGGTEGKEGKRHNQPRIQA